MRKIQIGPGQSPSTVMEEAGPLSAHKAQNRVLRPGLSFHYGAEANHEDYTGHGMVDDHIRIVLVLEGTVDVAYGKQQVRLASPSHAATDTESFTRDAAVITMHEPEAFRRTIRQGDVSRRISIGLSQQWIEETLCAGEAGTAYAAATHLGAAFWTASTHVRILAEQMLNPAPLQPQFTNLYLESRAIELVVEALTACRRAEPLPASQKLRPATFQRMCELKAWLCEQAAAPLSIDQIARQSNTTPSTLQRHFKLAHGMTVFDFLQQERLKLARHALEQDGLCVEAAAAIAGYTNPTSFATAFKRLFGLSPREAKPRW